MFPQGYAGPAERHNCTVSNVDLSSLSSWEFQGWMFSVGLMSQLSCGWIRRRTHTQHSTWQSENCACKKKEKPTEVLIGQVLHCLSDSVSYSSLHLEPSVVYWTLTWLCPWLVPRRQWVPRSATRRPLWRFYRHQANELGTFQSVRPAECERC